MKKVKYIILVAVAGILIFCCYRIVFAPHSYRDVVSREIDNIQPSINTVRRHIVGGTYRTLISVQNPLRLCRTGICRSLSAG